MTATKPFLRLLNKAVVALIILIGVGNLGAITVLGAEEIKQNISLFLAFSWVIILLLVVHRICEHYGGSLRSDKS